MKLAAGLLAVPQFARAQPAEDGFVVLRAGPASARLMGADGPQTGLWSFGPWPQPVLKARQGEDVKLRFINTLDSPITVHWHGVRGPAEMMSIAVAPGEDNGFDCVFAPPDAGTFLFGPVNDVSRQRDMGLYGLLIVEEAAPPANVIDLPLVLDDWRLDNDGRPEEDFGNLEDAIAQGRLGNWFTVNGAYRPRLEAPAGRPVRLRVVNAANVRTIGLLFKGADPLIVALDGQPVRPSQLGGSALSLAPCQRADLLIPEASQPVTLAFELFEDIAEVAYLERTGAAVAPTLPDNFALPANPVPAPAVLEGTRQVPLVIEGGAKGGLKSAKLRGEMLDVRALLERGYAWAFNGVAGLAVEPFATFKQGETVILAVENRTAFEQPLHVHGHVWQLIERDGRALEQEPLRDTAIVPARKAAKLAMVADNPGQWGLQSTIAERIDAGLFTTFSVE